MERYHVFVVPLHSSIIKIIPSPFQPSYQNCLRWTPVVYGPPNMEAYNYCKKLNSGILIEHKSIHAVKKTLTKLLENYDGELNKSQSNATLNANNFFGFQSQKEFTEFVLN